MSVLVETTLRCSRAGCSARFGPVEGWPGTVRRLARRDGWNSDDRCPAHSAGQDDDPTLFELLSAVHPS